MIGQHRPGDSGKEKQATNRKRQKVNRELLAQEQDQVIIGVPALERPERSQQALSGD